MENQELIGQVDEKQLQEWKDKYGVVYEIQVEDKVAYLRKIDRNSLSLALSFIGKDNVKFTETIFNNNCIGGEKEMINDTEYLPGVIEECLTFVNGVKSSYVKHSAKPQS